MMSDFPKNYNDFIGVKATTASSQSPLSLKRSDLVKKTLSERRVGGNSNEKKSGCAMVDLITIHLCFLLIYTISVLLVGRF